jgi:hypothetical protein
MAEKNGSGPRVQRREKWLDMPTEYEGFQVRVWLNPPAWLWHQFMRVDGGAERLAAASKIVLEHNGWLDIEGKPYPPPDMPEFWAEIPTELAACIMRAILLEQQNLPNSLAPMKRR